MGKADTQRTYSEYSKQQQKARYIRKHKLLRAALVLLKVLNFIAKKFKVNLWTNQRVLLLNKVAVSLFCKVVQVGEKDMYACM